MVFASQLSRRTNKVSNLILSLETLQKTALRELKEGDQVNLERALRLTDRLGGHIVTGHVDGIGEIVEKRKERDFLQLRIRVPESVSRYVVQKGSIAIDGISLTVNEYQEGEIRMTLIPYTIEKTTLKTKKGRRPGQCRSRYFRKICGKIPGSGRQESPDKWICLF